VFYSNFVVPKTRRFFQIFDFKTCLDLEIRVTGHPRSDFQSAFDSVDRQSLSLLLRSKGIPEKILQLLEDLYSNTFSCVRVDGELYLHGLRPPLEFDRAVL